MGVGKFIDLKLLDEFRFTQTGQIVGAFNSLGEERPSLYPKKKVGVRNYSPDDSPLVAWKGIRTIGEHCIFFRGVFTYRHTLT